MMQAMIGVPILLMMMLAGGAIAETPPKEQSNSQGYRYTPPTAQEMAPMRPDFMKELSTIQEPPEMLGKPMEARRPASIESLKLSNMMNKVWAPEKATHEQRAAAISEISEFLNSNPKLDVSENANAYGAIAVLACIDGADPQRVIGYANKAIGYSNDVVALRARMYLRQGDRARSLDDLEKIMADTDGHALVGGDATPRKKSNPCGWSIPDFDVFGNDSRALAAKGLYLSAFIGYGAIDKGTVKEAEIRRLFALSAKTWRSPIPHVLQVTLSGFGSEQSMNGASCIRARDRLVASSEVESACEKYDEGIRQKIRSLTSAILIDPNFAPALAARASKYLELGQVSYADNRPSRQLFELAIKDFTSAIAAGGRDLHMLYCDRALTLALVGRYDESILGYEQGMKYSKNGIESSPFVYQQLAQLYMKQGSFNKAAENLTQAIINSGSGMNSIVLLAGIKAFRNLYPEYGLLPDDILAEVIRRRYFPQFPESWNEEFIAKQGYSDGKANSTVLPELYILRGDAYMRAGKRAEAQADYRRVKSDAWTSAIAGFYFDERGSRTSDMPVPFPPPAPAQ